MPYPPGEHPRPSLSRWTPAAKRRMERAPAVEEPWLENALHLTSQGTQAVTAEADIALNQTFVVKLDLPSWNPSSHALSSTAGAGLKIRLRGHCRATVSARLCAPAKVGPHSNATSTHLMSRFGNPPNDDEDRHLK